LLHEGYSRREAAPITKVEMVRKKCIHKVEREGLNIGMKAMLMHNIYTKLRALPLSVCCRKG
jgi:hypothetical protein